MAGFDGLWFNKRDALHMEAQDVVSKALRKAGWKHTSQTHGSIWMWQKDIGGVLYSVSQDRAASIQEHFDRSAYFEQHPEELGD